MATALSTQARNATWKRLAELHPEMLAAILAEERVARGLPVVPTTGRRGRVSVQRVPAPAWLSKVAPRYIAPDLDISPAVWRTWVRLGVPVGREADVAVAVGVPLEVLWPQAQPKPARVKPPKPVGLHQCGVCGHRAASRPGLARHRQDEDHYDEDAA